MTADVLTALALILVSVAAFAHIATLPARAAMFPRLTAGLLFLLSVAYLARELLVRTEAPAVAFFHDVGRFAAALALIGLYAVAFPRVGYFTATFVFIPVFAATIGMRRIGLTLAGSAIVTAAIYVVFVVLLSRRLPSELLIDVVRGT